MVILSGVTGTPHPKSRPARFVGIICFAKFDKIDKAGPVQRPPGRVKSEINPPGGLAGEAPARARFYHPRGKVFPSGVGYFLVEFLVGFSIREVILRVTIKEKIYLCLQAF